MKIGVPKEIKTHEYRVGLVPGSVRELVSHGHQVLVESHAGMGIGITDDDYGRAGATVLPTAQAVFENADLIVKVKEPLPQETKMLRAGQIIFTYLHLTPLSILLILFQSLLSSLSRTQGLPTYGAIQEVSGSRITAMPTTSSALPRSFVFRPPTYVKYRLGSPTCQ